MIILNHPLLGEIELCAYVDTQFSHYRQFDARVLDADFAKLSSHDGIHYTAAVKATYDEGIKINGKTYTRLNFRGCLGRIRNKNPWCIPNSRQEFTEKVRDWLYNEISPWIVSQIIKHEDALKKEAHETVYSKSIEQVQIIEAELEEIRSALKRYKTDERS